MDRPLIGEVVRQEINRRFGTPSAFARQSTGVSKRTIERVIRGDETIQFATLQHIEGLLDLPRDALVLIGDHDLDELRAIGLEPDLLRWVSMRVSRTDEVG